MTGAAIDYARANAARAAKASMQSALDSTGLILSRDADTMSGPDLGTSVRSIFLAQFNRPEAQNVTVTQQFSAPQQRSFATEADRGGDGSDPLGDTGLGSHGIGDHRNQQCRAGAQLRHQAGLVLRRR